LKAQEGRGHRISAPTPSEGPSGADFPSHELQHPSKESLTMHSLGPARHVMYGRLKFICTQYWTLPTWILHAW
jgi:hypothetical protein